MWIVRLAQSPSEIRRPTADPGGIYRMEERRTAAKASSYVIAATAATAFSYFFLGGSRWSPALWAIFALLAVWIVVMNVCRDAGQKSRASYERWKLQIAFLMVVALLGSGIWHGSLWVFVLGACAWCSLARRPARLS